MQRIALAVSISVVLGFSAGSPVGAGTVEDYFSTATEGGYEGCFLVADRAGNIVSRSTEACAERYPPCSTFKIPNSLIGLETGAVEPDTMLPWDGNKKSYRSWERDHDLASAIRFSVVWYYQELARRVGEQKMQSYVDRFDYGNRDISGGLTRFWLGSSLKISADEQISFLSKLYTDKLPVSEASTNVVKEILLHRQSPDGQKPAWSLSAKTGSCRLGGGESLGWWVGYVEQGAVERLFATRIRGKGADGREARKLTLQLLADTDIAAGLGLVPIDVEASQ